MRCHYEVLEISQDADDSQIKSSYRKLALKWHPDKNLDNPDVAKEQFQLVQQAYEVLSDRNERAWYDNHREQILRGKDSEFKDNSLDVYQYFTTTCFKGYNDEEEGFYTIYRKVFEEIAREDMDFMEEKEEFIDIPPFGTSTSDYDNVVGPFYAYWSSYSTKKSFVWLDLYSSNETRDRRLFKLMDKENKKIRLKAKKERNDEVRALVAFVRKRDKRVQEYSKRLEAKILENRKKQEELSRQKRLERKKALNESQSQAEWTKFDNVKNELEQIEKRLAEQFGEDISCSENEDEDSVELDNLYCVACNKVFKTPKAFENHESSKKHRENVEKLKETMAEEEELNEVESLNEDDAAGQPNGFHTDDEISIVEESEDEQEAKRKKKQRKSKNVIQVNSSDHEELVSLDDHSTDISELTFSSNTSKKQKRKNKKSTPKADPAAVNASADKDLQDENVNENQELPRKSGDKVKKSRKPKEKREKKDPEAVPTEVDTSNCCVTCKTDFASKNKLFDHLKKTGHSVYLPQNVTLKNKKKSVKEK